MTQRSKEVKFDPNRIAEAKKGYEGGNVFGDLKAFIGSANISDEFRNKLKEAIGRPDSTDAQGRTSNELGKELFDKCLQEQKGKNK